MERILCTVKSEEAYLDRHPVATERLSGWPAGHDQIACLQRVIEPGL